MRLVFSRAVLTAFVVVAAGAGCGTPTVDFDVPISAETSLEGAGLIDQILGNFGFADFANVDLEASQEFKNEDVRREQVVDARMTFLNLSIKSPQGANFDWLDSVKFSVAADGEDTVEAASATIDNGETDVSLDVNDVDLSPFVRSETMEITTEADARSPPNDTTITVNLNFKIKAEVL